MSKTRYKSNRILRLRWWLSSQWYWLRTHTRDRYHIVDIRQGALKANTWYKWGWIDSDHKLLLANFTILCDFVENEVKWTKTNGPIPFNTVDCADAANMEMWNGLNNNIWWLYQWWIRDRKHNYAKLEANYSYELSEELFKEDSERLIKLISLRGAMWT